MKRFGNKKQKGFTLVELMISIALMAALMFFVVPKLTSGKANTDGSIAADHLKGLLMAVAQWELTRGSFSGMNCQALLDNSMNMSGLANCAGGAPNGGDFTAAVSGRTVTLSATSIGDRACQSAQNYLTNMDNGTATCTSGTISLVYSLN